MPRVKLLDFSWFVTVRRSKVIDFHAIVVAVWWSYDNNKPGLLKNDDDDDDDVMQTRKERKMSVNLWLASSGVDNSVQLHTTINIEKTHIYIFFKIEERERERETKVGTALTEVPLSLSLSFNTAVKQIHYLLLFITTYTYRIFSDVKQKKLKA